MDTLTKNKLTRIFAALATGVLFCIPNPGSAVNILATDDISVIVPPSHALDNQVSAASQRRLKADSFYISNWQRKYKLKFIGDEDGAYRVRVDGRIPAGFYELKAKAANGTEQTIIYNFQMHSPLIDTVETNGIYEGASIKIMGQYFSKNPRVFIAYRTHENGKLIRQACPSVQSSYEHDDPFDNVDTKYPMDVLNGKSALEVIVPKLKAPAPLDLKLVIESDTGFSIHYLDQPPIAGLSLVNDTPQRGQLTGYSVRQENLPAKTIKKYLINSITESVIKQWAVEWIIADGKVDDMQFKNDLKLYTVYYMTANVKGQPVKASGVVAIPKKGPDKTASLLSYQHGTMLKKDEAPSLSNGAELGFGVALASAEGYVVSVPDHLGLGAAAKDQTTLVHPYCQWQPIAYSDGDMVRAIKALLSDPDFIKKHGAPPKLDDRVLLTGYSEGGYATLGLHREFEAHPDTYGIKAVTGSAPMAGPYSLSQSMRAIMVKKENYPEPFFAPYTLVTLNDTYNIYKTPSEYLKPNYDTTLPPYIDGEHSAKQVNELMPKQIWQILDDKVYTEFDLGKGAIFDKLKLNDLSDPDEGNKYKLDAPVLLVHGETDDLVPVDNADRTYKYFSGLIGKKNIEKRYIAQRGLIRNLHWLNGTAYHELYATYSLGEAWDWLRNLK